MITVITPVYNDGVFLRRAIESVLIQSEVSEYVLVDDGSTDNSWEIIKEFERKDNRVVGLQHPDKRNHGRPRTRNLGIQYSSNDWIAFLDADDFYLENRFGNDSILMKDKSIDGIYNAIGFHYYDSFKGNKNLPEALTTLTEKIPAEMLFENMNPVGNKGWFHCNGFLIKKECLMSIGGFNKKLYIAQDTELFLKLSIKYKLVGGILDNPVAKRGVHGDNLFLSKDDIYFFPYTIMYLSLMKFIFKQKQGFARKELIINKFLEYLRVVPLKNNFRFFFKYWFLGVSVSIQTLTNIGFYKVFYETIKYIGLIKIKPKFVKSFS